MGGLAAEIPLLVHDTDGYIFLDIDDTIIEVHGYQKEGSGYGYSGVRRLDVFIATVKTDLSAPGINSQRLRCGADVSVTARMDPAIKRAIGTIPDSAWTAI
ncbi:hypothetical protein E3O62_08360 [Cryobacterium sp. TMT2-15-1]|nr:hypothetical protein E3O62_08360 [Cryobacterium sp. TMT2-15-1]